MEQIVINPVDLWQVIVAICGGIIALSGAGAVIAGGYCTAKNGIAAYSKAATRARVLKRIDDTHVEVFIR